MRSIAIIPARGGSKRIPMKNILDFYGKPMIAYTIEAALESNKFDDVIVSTDCKKIADISVRYGASVPFLREVHNDDFSTVSDVIIYVIKKLIELGYGNIDTVSLLLPNCPLRKASDIIGALDTFHKSERNYQISAFNYGWINPWWAHTIDEKDIASKVFSAGGNKTRSQDLEKLFCPTGAIWIANVNALIKSGTFYGPDYTFYIMDWKNSVDIDSYEDLEMAKVIFQLM